MKITPYMAVSEKDKSLYFKEEFKSQVENDIEKWPNELGEKHPFNFEDAEKVYKTVGIVSAFINKIVDNIVGEFSIKAKNKNSLALIKSFIHESNLTVILREWIREALKKGNGFMEIDLKNQKVRALNANYMYVQRNNKGTIEGYNQFILNPKRFTITSRKLIPFKSHEICHLKINASPGEAYGWGLIMPNERVIENTILNEADYQKMITRKAGAPIHVQVGIEGENTDSNAVDSIKNSLVYMTNRTEWVTDGNVKMNVLDFGEIGKNITDNLMHNFRMLVAGFEVPEVMMGSGQLNEGIAKVQLETFQRKIASWQEEIETIIEQQIFRPLLRENKLDEKIEFIWNLPSEEEINNRISQLNMLMQNMYLSNAMKLKIQEEIARLLNFENIDQIMIDSEKEQEAQIEQPEVPGAKPNAKEKQEEHIEENKSVTLETPILTETEKNVNIEKNDICQHKITEFIKKIGDEWCVFSHQTGKNFGCYKSKKEAEDRLAQISKFKDEAEVCKCSEEINKIKPFEEMTIQEFSNLQEISGFNYSDYLLNILSRLKIDEFNDLKAITEADVENGLLSNEQIEKLRTILKNGFKKNKSMRDIENDIKDSLKLKDRIKEDGGIIPKEERPVMISRTETIRLANLGLLDTYKENDIEEVRWLSALSDRTCDLCDSENGKVYKLNESYGLIPKHINCRCTWLSVI
jgi:SPP1 gp7 family putative phage head morphogenesis protein